MTDPTYRFLVVDDTEFNRDLLRRRLERRGYEVVEAANGRQALDLLGEQSFDLVLLDLHMPEVSGYEVLEAMRQDTLWRHIPVVVVTAVDDLESTARSIALGAEDYLLKPFNASLLDARIGACLEKIRLRRQEQEHLRQIRVEKQRADDLLHVLFPHSVVEELISTGDVRPRRYQRVAVLFADVVGFTSYCDQRSPEEVIGPLRELFERFEELVDEHQLEKIKTIGDAFLATAGLLSRLDNPVLSAVRCALDMLAESPRGAAGWQVRVGVHYGPVVAGLVGRRQYAFDLWGDTVNTAARVQNEAQPGTLVLSATAWQQVADRCRGESLGLVPLKGKGDVELFRFKSFLPT